MKKKILIIVFFITLISCKKDDDLSILANTVWESDVEITTFSESEGNTASKLYDDMYVFNYETNKNIITKHTYLYITSGQFVKISFTGKANFSINNDSLYINNLFVGKRK